MYRCRTQGLPAAVVASIVSTPFFAMSGDALTGLGSAMFDDAMMAQKLPSAVVQRFNQCLITGDPTPEEDQKV